MRCQNSPDNNRRCKRTASKIIIIIKDTNNVKQQSKWGICNDCFNEKMYGDQLFKDSLIRVTELNNKK